MAFDGATWNEAIPTDSTVANEIDDYMRDLRYGVRGRMAQEHVWPASQTGTSQAGMHSYITLQPYNSATAPVVGTAAGLLYMNTAQALIYVNSASAAMTLVSSAGGLPIITTGTLGGVVICSSANPTGVMALTGSADGLALISHSNTAAASWGTVAASGISGALGAWSADLSGACTDVLAATDLLIIAYGAGDDAYIEAYTDANATPTTLRARQETRSSGETVTGYVAITLPVKKGHYWRIAGYVTKVYAIPLGA